MPNSNAFYITTPIYYVNDAPHLGHAYTTVAADVISRYKRLCGDEVYFLTGTDEHGQKVFRAAENRGVSPQQHVDELSKPYRELWERLKITNDDFIRTTEARHVDVVQSILTQLKEQGDIYQDSYEGWYSTAEERFWTEKDLIDGKCPASGQPVELIEETNYFFRMSKYAPKLAEWLENNPNFIRPTSRRNEVLGALKKGVGDLCITRPRHRLPWGIAIPWDENYVTYVWFDALTNYISAIGYGSDDEKFNKFWPANFHLVGKDILTTHSIYWSTMLFAMGLAPTECLYAHGWWTAEGQKMSKSLKNVVNPHLLIDVYGADAVRYFLMREIGFGADGDFSHNGFMVRYNAELANDLGNLAHRALSMTTKWLGGVVPTLGTLSVDDIALGTLSTDVVARFDASLQNLQYKDAIGAMIELVGAGNKYIDTQAPWALNKSGNSERLSTVMRLVLEVCRVAAALLEPFCPERAPELARRLGTTNPGFGDGNLETIGALSGLSDGAAVEVCEPLFPRITELPSEVVEALEVASTKPKEVSKKKQHPKKASSEKPKKNAKKDSSGTTSGEISFEDFTKVNFRTGVIVSAEKHPDADRLLVVQVDIGEESPRQIVAGIADRYTPEQLEGMTTIVVTNLKPVKLRGVLSSGMLLAAGAKGVEGLATISEQVEPGTVVR